MGRRAEYFAATGSLVFITKINDTKPRKGSTHVFSTYGFPLLADSTRFHAKTMNAAIVSVDDLGLCNHLGTLGVFYRPLNSGSRGGQVLVQTQASVNGLTDLTLCLGGDLV